MKNIGKNVSSYSNRIAFFVNRLEGSLEPSNNTSSSPVRIYGYFHPIPDENTDLVHPHFSRQISKEIFLCPFRNYAEKDIRKCFNDSANDFFFFLFKFWIHKWLEEYTW